MASDSIKLEAIKAPEVPKDIAEVLRPLEMLNYLARFLSNTSEITTPLYEFS